MRGIELKEFNKAEAALRGSGDVERLKLMDTYSLSYLRPDGHVGPYRTPYPFAKDKKMLYPFRTIVCTGVCQGLSMRGMILL